MFPLTEDQLQQKVITALNDETFLNLIIEREAISNALHADENPHYLPGYQIDFQLRTKYARSAHNVINALEYLEIINGEKISNISLQKDTKNQKERLYPDIILANQEQSSFILIELKKDAQSEREAITELLAYAIEIKNHLPNIADSDINLIVISPVFNALLDHSVSSLILGTKFNVLALNVFIKESNMFLPVHFPSAWTDIWQNNLPPYAFSSLSLVPYNDKEKDKLPNQYALYDAIEDIIMFEGARNNSHGFFIIWENKVWFETDANFCISIYQVNPFVFLQEAIGKDFTLNVDEPLSRYILKEFNDNGPYQTMESLMQLAKAVKTFLDKWYNTHYEDFSSWTDHMYRTSNFRSQAMPIIFNAWGNIGDYTRYFFFHPSLVKTGYISEKQLNSLLYHRDPVYGIETINRISGLTLFEDGVFNATSLFKYAMQVRNYLTISDAFYRTKKEKKKFELLAPKLFFSGIELLSSLREIQYRVLSSTKDFGSTHKFQISLYDVPKPPLKNIKDHLNWFTNIFLDDNQFYQMLFGDFFSWTILYMEEYLDEVKKEDSDKIRAEILGFVKSYLIILLNDELVRKTSFYGDDLLILTLPYFGNKTPDFKSKKAIVDAVNKIADNLIIDLFESHFLEIIDKTSFAVFHPLVEFNDINFIIKNLDTLKAHLIKRFEEGHRYGAIFIQANGNIGIGVLSENQRLMAPITDPLKEVFLSMDESGIGIVRRVTWEELDSGEPFKTFTRAKNKSKNKC